jgi:3'(2'), 5'-bisphosphate nucleotidase
MVHGKVTSKQPVRADLLRFPNVVRRITVLFMTEADLVLATSCATAAARAILDVRTRARTRHDTKADASPVTEADLAADRLIRALLAVTGDVIVTEEAWTQAKVPSHGRVWIVDPLDGTRDFVAGSPDYVVQVALVVDGVPRVGVVCQPETMRTWRGVVDGLRSRCERIDADGTVHRRVLHVDDGVPPAPRLVVSVSHPSAGIEALATQLHATVMPRGSVGLKIGALVDGEADLYATDSKHIKVWDTAAPAAILAAAGGAMTAMSGTQLRYDSDLVHNEGVLAMTPAAARRWRTSIVPQR